jgi:hypothetical protein
MKMRFLVLVLLFVIPLDKVNAQNLPKYFSGGFQYGLALNTVYKYTDDVGYFDGFYYGKKITAAFGVFVKRQIQHDWIFESGFAYSRRGTGYRHDFKNVPKYKGLDIPILELDYISVPIVFNKLSKDKRQLKVYRYGIDIAYKFLENTPQIIGPAYGLYKDFDISGVVGAAFSTNLHSFFKNQKIVLDFRFSILSITNENYFYVLESTKSFKVLPLQRNFSLNIALQYNICIKQ